MIGIYSRISSDKVGSTSVEYQEKRGIEFANSIRVPYTLYSDRSISGGADIEDRPAFNRLLDDIENKTITSIYISNSDRAARKETTWFRLVELLLKYNITLYENGLLIDLNDDSVLMMQGMKAVVDASERRKTSKKQKRRLKENAIEGKVHGAVLPYGYSKDKNKYLIIDEEEAQVVKTIYKMFLEGSSINGIATFLTDTGVKTRFQKMGGTRVYKTPLTGHELQRENDKSEWARSVVKKILTRPLYKGVRKWKVGKGNLQEIHYFDLPHLAIINPVEWEKVNKSYISRKGAIKGKVNEHRYLLPPLLECQECGELYYGHLYSATRAYYKCRSYRKRKRVCGSKALPLEAFNDFITAIVFGQLYDKVMEQLDSGGEGEQQRYFEQLRRLEEEIKKWGGSQKRINNIYAEGDYSKEEFRQQKERITNKLSDLQLKKANTEQILSNLKAPENILRELEATLVTPFFEKMEELGYPYDTTYGNPIKDKVEQIFKGQLGQKLPFHIKQKAIRKYIKAIMVTWDKKNAVSIIEVSFKIPIENQKYLVDSTFLLAVNYQNRSAVYVNTERVHYQTDKTNARKFKALEELVLL